MVETLLSPVFENQYIPLTSTVSGAQIVKVMFSLQNDNSGALADVAAFVPINNIPINPLRMRRVFNLPIIVTYHTFIFWDCAGTPSIRSVQRNTPAFADLR